MQVSIDIIVFLPCLCENKNKKVLVGLTTPFGRSRKACHWNSFPKPGPNVGPRLSNVMKNGLRPTNPYFTAITSLINVGPHNITMGCWELSLNLSLLAQLFEHPDVIFRGPTKQEMNVE